MIFFVLAQKNVLHTDAYFENIVTDGDSFFVCDYGLALSSSFQLDEAQQNFLKTHFNFECLIKVLFGRATVDF